MKKVLILPVLALALLAPAFVAQAQQVKGPEGETQNSRAASSDNSGSANKEGSKEAAKEQAAEPEGNKPRTSDASDKKEAEKPAASSTASVTPLEETKDNHAATSDAPLKTTQTVPAAVSPASSSPASDAPASSAKTSAATAAATATTTSAAPPSPMSIYRLGVGDVLDIRLLNASSRESTLFTVMAGGLLEYPLAGAPVQVAGLTTDEVAAQLASRVKVYENPQFVVSVREYASHSLIVTGLVSNPGPRILRREAMPLYVVLAEAQPQADAARATIMRAGVPNMTIDLSDSAATSALVQSGDVIKVTAAPPAAPQFYFIGGQVNSPGQKDFHAGLTLTQAILASGGATRFASSKVRVSRQGADGRLSATEYNLKQIEDGKVPDPSLQPGDRIEVGRGHW